MKRICSCWRCLCASLAKIHIVDKFLLVFMVLLLSQSSYNLFVNHTASGESAHIDVIIRTSTAAIFGYFLSTNFIRHASSGISKSTAKGVEIPPPASGDDIQNRIGFTVSDPQEASGSPDMGGAVHDHNPDTNESIASRLQIFAASLIGLFCLVILILLRNVSELNADITASASATATVAQFRDIVSGCIGFLIGCPTSSPNKPK